MLLHVWVPHHHGPVREGFNKPPWGKSCDLMRLRGGCKTNANTNVVFGLKNPSWDCPQTCTIGLLCFSWYSCITNILCSDVTGFMRGNWVLIVWRIHRGLNWCSYRTKMLFDQWDERLSVGFLDYETKSQALLLSYYTNTYIRICCPLELVVKR